MDSAILFSVICSIIAILYGVISISWILKQSDGNDKMKEIASAIQEGASAYLNRQYTTISIVGVVLFLILGFVDDTGFRTTVPGRETRRRLSYIEVVQRPSYSEYFARHGLKVQAVTLHNGLFVSIYLAPLRISDAELQI